MGGSLVGVGRPEVEGHERELEAQTGEEEDQRHNLKRRAGDEGHHVVEVERAGGAVEERDAVEHQTAREEGAEDVFGTRLGRVVLVLVEGDQAGHRHRGQLEPDEEEQEVGRANHEVHAQQRRERQHVELALLVGRILAPQPRGGLHADHQSAD